MGLSLSKTTPRSACGGFALQEVTRLTAQGLGMQSCSLLVDLGQGSEMPLKWTKTIVTSWVETAHLNTGLNMGLAGAYDIAIAGAKLLLY